MAPTLSGVLRGFIRPKFDIRLPDINSMMSAREAEERLDRSGGRIQKRIGLRCKKLLLATFIMAVCLTSVDAKKKEYTNRPCPMAFHEIGGKCYFYGYFPLNWYRAAEFCHSFGRGVSLASIESVQENYFIKNWLSVNGNHNTGVWIGGSDNGHNGRWAWFPTGQLIDYSNWGPSQPSGGDQHCMYMVGGLLGYQWADFHCEFDMHFLCEEDVNDNEPWR
ncbi:perlucin-like isoform X2 [Palaemon carinicauda]|uniref:perlucin-like isoform X2 n=1 Tax=Palaemon carinicauda TaxID=392227 RepID=UPI0035B60061